MHILHPQHRNAFGLRALLQLDISGINQAMGGLGVEHEVIICKGAERFIAIQDDVDAWEGLKRRECDGCLLATASILGIATRVSPWRPR